MYTLKIGPQAPLADNLSIQPRGARDGTAVVQDGHGRYVEVGSRNGIYYCVNSAAQALSLTGTTTYTGLVVYNKPNSGKNLAILNASYAVTIAATGVGAILLFSQAPAASLPALTTTNVSAGPSNGLLNQAQSGAASVASSCTLAANPIPLKPCISVPWVTGTAQAAFSYNEDLGGQIIVPPGAGIGFVAVTTAITGVGFISWEEVAV